jgi:NDP-sugar pyrophosphorylase family protein
LRRLASCGFKDVTICTGYLAELIRAVCGDGAKFGLNIEYVGEEQPLGTAGPLSLISNLTDPFIVMNGDLLTTLDFRAMLRFHQRQKADFTLGLFPRQVKIDFGVIQFDARGEFNGYREKPTYNFEVSMGVNIIRHSALKYVTPGKHLDMPDLVLKVHGGGGRVKCYREACRWLDIGRMDDYAMAQDEFAQNETTFLNGTGREDNLDNRRRRVHRSAPDRVPTSVA